MCLSIPGKVINVREKKAEVEVFGERREVFLAISDVNAGDWVLISGGMVLAVLEESVAIETIELLQKLR
jgi:hydrogenase assembly chaperone HypC/HupF